MLRKFQHIADAINQYPRTFLVAQDSRELETPPRAIVRLFAAYLVVASDLQVGENLNP